MKGFFIKRKSKKRPLNHLEYRGKELEFILWNFFCPRFFSEYAVELFCLEQLRNFQIEPKRYPSSCYIYENLTRYIWPQKYYELEYSRLPKNFTENYISFLKEFTKYWADEYYSGYSADPENVYSEDFQDRITKKAIELKNKYKGEIVV